MSTKLEYTFEENWTDLPLHQILYKWAIQNIGISPEIITIFVYLGFFLIAWYTIVWFIRFIMKIIWPLFFIASAIILYRILQFYEPEEIGDIISKYFEMLFDILPLSYLISGILNVAENILVKTLAGLLSVTCSLGNML